MRFFNIHQSGGLIVLAWLVPHETAAVSVQVLWTPYNHAPCQFMQSHICKVHAYLAVTCHLHFWQNDRDLLCATAVTRGGMETEIRVSTENWPWRRKFSRHSCRDLNPQLFSHESGALTTELSPSPQLVCLSALGKNVDVRGSMIEVFVQVEFLGECLRNLLEITWAQHFSHWHDLKGDN